MNQPDKPLHSTVFPITLSSLSLQVFYKLDPFSQLFLPVKCSLSWVNDLVQGLWHIVSRLLQKLILVILLLAQVIEILWLSFPRTKSLQILQHIIDGASSKPRMLVGLAAELVGLGHYVHPIKWRADPPLREDPGHWASFPTTVVGVGLPHTIVESTLHLSFWNVLTIPHFIYQFFCILGCLLFVTIINKAAMNIAEEVSFWQGGTSFRYMPKNSVVGPWGRFWSFQRTTIFTSLIPIHLQSHQQLRSVPFEAHTHQHELVLCYWS